MPEWLAREEMVLINTTIDNKTVIDEARKKKKTPMHCAYLWQNVRSYHPIYWKALTNAAEKRRRLWKDSKYKSVCDNLPDEYNSDKDGFHLRQEKEKGSLLDSAAKLNDRKLLTRIADGDFFAKEVKYHHSCKRDYINKADNFSVDQVVNQQQAAPTRPGIRDVHNEVFSQIADYVQLFIIDGQQPEMLLSVQARYLSLLADRRIVDSPYTTQKLCENLLAYFQGNLCSGKRTNKEGVLLCFSRLEGVNTTEIAFQQAASIKSKVYSVARHLRQIIQNIQKEYDELPHPIIADVASNGQAEAPELLRHFFRVLYTGQPTTEGLSERVNRYISSSTDDAVSATTRDIVKPGKHLLLGLGMNSLVESRRVIERLNRFGHSIGYHTAESLEAGLAMSVKEKEMSIPDGLLRKAGLGTVLAWDNYDENLKTLSG